MVRTIWLQLGSDIYKLDEEFTIVDKIPELFFQLRGVAVDDEGYIWIITRTRPSRLSKITKAGVTIYTVNLPIDYASKAVIDRDGTLWVVSGEVKDQYVTYREVKHIDKSGNILGTISPNLTYSIMGIALDPAGNIWLSTGVPLGTRAPRIHKIDKLGNVLFEFDPMDKTGYSWEVRGIAFDNEGFLYTTDQHDFYLHKWNRELKLVQSAQRQGYGNPGDLDIEEEEVPVPTYTLTINTTPGGTTDPAPASYEYKEGATALVTAIPESGYEFDHWDLDGASRTENPINVLMDADHTLTAYFKAIPTYTLTISTTIGGTTDPAPGTYEGQEGATIQVTAIPDTGYFDHWILDGVTYTTNPITVVMDADHSLTAYFSEIPPPPPTTYNLNISTTTGGTTNPPPGIYEYEAGTTASVTAIPENGYYFDHWLLDGITYTTNPINVVMDKDYTLTAYFMPTYTLTLSTSAGGTTQPAPGVYTYAAGSEVVIKAVPNAGYIFDHWTLDGATRTDNPITVVMNQNHSLTAYFKALPPPEYTLTISTTLGGTTNPTPGAYGYPQNTNVPVTAIPNTNYNFDHWILDGTTYTTNPITVLMNTNHSLTAYFSEVPPPPPEQYNLNLNSTIGGLTDPPTGVYQETSGSTVTVTATPQADMFFDHWELDGTVRTENPITVTMDKDHTLLAVFSSTPPQPPLPIGWILVPVILGGILVGYLLSRKK